MSQIERTIRLSQTITPFGVGAIYDILGESLVACDTSYWRGRGDRIDSPRLANYLSVDHLKIPPSKPSIFGESRSGGLPFFRFPSWLFCSSCRRMYFWRPEMEEAGQSPECSHCGGRQLVPMRFIMVCENGHMSDVPWDRWAHSQPKGPNQKQCQSKKLKFVSRSDIGGGLRSLEIHCRDCGASRNLSGITQEDRVKAIPGITCFGKQPWQSSAKAEDCDCTPQVVQRGASNVHYPSICSGIDIPPFSKHEVYAGVTREVTNHAHFNVVTSTNDDLVRERVAGTIADDVGCETDLVLEIAEREEAEREGIPHPHSSEESEDLEVEEWKAFITPDPDQTERDRFVTEHVNFLSTELQSDSFLHLSELIDHVVIARKLREVRALTGFHRYRPGEGGGEESTSKKVLPDCGAGLDWLPAIEVFGEGVFLSLEESRLRTWENREKIRERVQPLEDRRKDSVYGPILSEGSPRFVLLHTLAHLLIRQLAFECGYSSSSLRERVYCSPADSDPPMSGILIYTAAGDVEGTLGGLARQGEPPRLARTLLSALQRGSWCSSDPICAERESQGMDGMNLGACHSCTLLSETSCTNMNLLLDRVLLTGEHGDIPGFFEAPLTLALENSSLRATSA